jgi:hypothetical protein
MAACSSNKAIMTGKCERMAYKSAVLEVRKITLAAQRPSRAGKARKFADTRARESLATLEA